MKKIIPPFAYIATKPKQEEVHPHIKGHMEDLQKIEDKGKSWLVKHLKKGGPIKKENPIPEVKGPKRTRDIWNTQTPNYKDWETDNSKWKKWLADNIAQSQTTIHFNHDRGDWLDKWGDKVRPEDALAEQQQIEKVYNTIYTPEMETQDELNKIAAEAKAREISKIKHPNDKELNPPKAKPEKIIRDHLLTFEWPEPEESPTTVELQNRENELKNLIFKSALNKIEDAASGIGQFEFQRLRLESGGPTDRPPTLEDYLKFGLSLAVLTDDERRIVQEMLDKTLGTKK